MAKRTVAIFHFYFSYVSNVITVCDASPSTRYRSSAASGFAGWPGRSRWTEAARSPVQSTFESLPSATYQHAGKECEARQCLQPTCMRSISCFSTLTMAVSCSFWRKGAFKLKLIIHLLNASISNYFEALNESQLHANMNFFPEDGVSLQSRVSWVLWSPQWSPWGGAGCSWAWPSSLEPQLKKKNQILKRRKKSATTTKNLNKCKYKKK